MLEAIKANIELSEIFLRIDVTSFGNDNLNMLCIARNYTVKVVFQYFDGLENRSEFFDRRDADGINSLLLSNSNYYYPITYIPYDQFKESLSVYESINATESTRLWRFISVNNFVEVYSKDTPRFEKLWCDNSILSD
jgi:hypothetical protein